jgi:hypothetical protein
LPAPIATKPSSSRWAIREPWRHGWEEAISESGAQVDVDENDETAMWAKVSAMPTFHVYSKGKKVMEPQLHARDLHG